jgi:hypothetical protein
MNLDRNTIIYAAALLAITTSAVLVWAVSHPCDCDKGEGALDDIAAASAEMME